MSANLPTSRRERERGQIIVIFALALVAIIAMVGLVLDGGSAFAMRRDEQSAADLAALAAANDYMLNSDASAGDRSRPDRRRSNGYTHGTGGVVVNVTITTSNGAEAQVDISAPHHNNFASIVGHADLAGRHDRQGTGRLSRIRRTVPGRSSSASTHSRTRWPAAGGLRRQGPSRTTSVRPTATSRAARATWPGPTTGPATSTPTASGTSSSATASINKTLAFGEYIGQHNNGNHTHALRRHERQPGRAEHPGPGGRPQRQLPGLGDLPRRQRRGRRDKHIKGYFVSPFVN